MVRPFFIFFGLILCLKIYSQSTDSTNLNQELHLKNGTVISSGETLPYWLKNQNSSRFAKANSSQIYSQLVYSGNYHSIRAIRLNWEAEAFFNLTDKVKSSLIQGNLKITTDRLNFKFGMDEEYFGENNQELSLGNLINNTNAKPIPKISLSTNGWKRSPVLSKNIFFKAHLAHGWFESDRVQSKAFLHQKYFYLQARFFNEKLRLSMGLIHNAQWGGKDISSEFTQPTGLKNFGKIFLGSAGGEDALITDQKNVLGNHLGTYDLSASYESENLKIRNYWQFLWEDLSGLVPLNWRDGLLGLELNLKKFSLINQIVFEIVRTNSQDADGGYVNGVKQVVPDNFLNNGVYRSGWTHQREIIGSPLFLKIQRSGNNGYKIFNMINAWNIGINGRTRSISYQIKIINFRNSGQRLQKIEPIFKLFATQLSLEKSIKESINLGLRVDYQNGNIYNGKKLALSFFIKHRLKN